MLRKALIVVLLPATVMACTCASDATPATPPAQPAQQPTRPLITTQPESEPLARPTPTENSPRAEDIVPLTPAILSINTEPDVRLAPFYVAVDKGYFASQGLAIEFDYSVGQNLLALAGAGQRQFVIGSGDQVIMARAQGLPVVYVMNWYRRSPLAVVSRDEIKGPEDLIGKTVGLPSTSGTYAVGWQGFLSAAGIDPAQVNVETIDATPAQALVAGQVGAAVGDAADGPIQLRQQGYSPSVIEIADYVDLVGAGIVTNEQIVQEQPDVVMRVVTASLLGLRDTVADPEGAFDIAQNYVPEAGESPELQLAILKKSIEYWNTDRLGYSEPAVWETTQQLLWNLGLIQETGDVNQMFTNRFVAAVETQ